ncbi:hypothetical protein O9993_07120 [Vibrio lentus]|nr:hypothetical protein [Vibrio lentus]
MHHDAIIYKTAKISIFSIVDNECDDDVSQCQEMLNISEVRDASITKDDESKDDSNTVPAAL